MCAAADVIERVACEHSSDPSTDDLTVPLAIECAEKDAEIARLRKEIARLMNLACALSPGWSESARREFLKSLAEKSQ
jgi:hypothetical protein